MSDKPAPNPDAKSESKGAGSDAEAKATEAAEREVVEIEPGPGEPPPLPPRKAKSDEPSPLSVTSNLPSPHWPPKVAGDLMTRKIITITESEPVGDLEGWMTRFRFRHLPVVGEGMKLVGLISHKDYLHAALGTGPDGKPMPKVDAKTTAGAIMRKNVVVAHVDSPLTTACQVMLKEKIGCLPVILDDNTLVGIITDTDLVRLALGLLERKD